MDSKLIITAFLALCSASSQAQSFPQGNYQTDIRLINEHTLRFEVRPAEYDNLEHFSYHQPATAPMVWNQVEQSDSLIVWRNRQMRLVYHKISQSVRVEQPNGSIIWSDHPDFPYRSQNGFMTHYSPLQEGERFIGLGEKTGNLDRRGTGYTLWNSDYFGYTTDQDPLYVSIPFYMGLSHNQWYGLYVDHASKSEFNFGAGNTEFSSFGVNDEHLVFYLFVGDPQTILLRYTELTGRHAMPPHWALGFHQSRWGYSSSQEMLSLAAKFRERDLPIDALHFDIHYMQDYKVFTFNEQHFPDPSVTVEGLQGMGIEPVVIIDPGVKVEKGYKAYEAGKSQDIFVKFPNGQAWTAGVWPGNCHFPDFTNPKGRDYWQEQMKAYTQLNIRGYWNDMNEPAAWGREIPRLLEFDLEGNGGDLNQARNLYAFQMNRASYEAGVSQTGQRPFVLTRAGCAGSQRYAAVWTGDNVASDDHLLLSARLVNSLGSSGMGFCGADVGGFTGNTSADLFTRWISLGCFTPFFRVHKQHNQLHNDPWTYGEEYEVMNRHYLRLRYQLMPYLQSAFYEMSQTGWPINQSLALHWGSDARCYDSRYQEEFLFGPSILVAPCKSTQRLSEVWLPEYQGQDLWYRLWDDQAFAPGEHRVEAPLHALPVFVKAGSMIPEHESQHYRNHADHSDTLSLHLYWGGSTVSQYVLHADNDSLAAKTAHLSCRFDPHTGELSLQVSGDWDLPYSHIQLHIHGCSTPLSLGESKSKSSAMTSTWSNDFALQENLYMERVNRHNATPIQSTVLPVSSSRYWLRD